jgi:hypothetical protein
MAFTSDIPLIVGYQISTLRRVLDSASDLLIQVVSF